MKKLTDTQYLILWKIKNFIKINKYSPSIRDIAAMQDITVKGAYDHVMAIKKKGFLEMIENKSRTMVLSNKALRMVFPDER